VQVATPPTASEFRGGIIGVTLRPVSGADFASPITDEHLLHGVNWWFNVRLRSLLILQTRRRCTSHFFSQQHGAFNACLWHGPELLGIGSARRRLCIISATFWPSSTGSALGQWPQHNVHMASAFHNTVTRFCSKAGFYSTTGLYLLAIQRQARCSPESSTRCS